MGKFHGLALTHIYKYHRLQLSRNLWDSPGFLAIVPLVPEGSTTSCSIIGPGRSDSSILHYYK